MSNKPNRSNKKFNRKLSKPRNFKSINLSFSIFKHVKEASLIMLIAVAGFLMLAFFSYHPFDPGWSRTAQHLQIVNMAGGVGAWWADLLLYFFGILAYLFPLILLYACLLGLFQQEFNHSITLWWIRIVGFLVTLCSGCGSVSLLSQQQPILVKLAMPVSLGGVIGDSLSAYLYKHVNFWGGGLILAHCLLAGLTAMVGISWFNSIKLLHVIMKKILSISIKILVGNFRLIKRLSCACFMNLMNRHKKHGAVLTASNKQNKVTAKVGNTLIIDQTKTMLKKLIKPHSVFKAVAKDSTNNLHDNKLKITKAEDLITNQRQAAKDFIKQMQHKNLNNCPSSKNPNQANNIIPSLDLLEKNNDSDPKYLKEQLPDPNNIQNKLSDFGIAVKIVEIFPGPVVTRVEMELAPGTKANKITSLSKDLARSLSVPSVRVVEVIPGKTVVGLEIPNKHRTLVRLREILSSEQYNLSASPLTLALGKDIAGIPIVADLAKMPHLLVAGTTGSGKSVGVNAMLLSILFKASVDEVRLILIDPKMLELSIYDGIPHLLTPVVTDMKDAANALNWCVFEMERRYKLMASIGVRNLLSFNLKVQAAFNTRTPMLNPIYNPNFPEGINNKKHLEKLPYIVVIIDEFADMMMVVGKKVEEQISRIAQKARAAGIHMILATQRPSVDVITGLIKANIPTRIAFQVSSRIDSRTILDQQGAEQLLGYGDLLYLPPGSGIPMRVHGAFVSDEEVHKVVSHLKSIENLAATDVMNLAKIEDNFQNIACEDEVSEDLDPLYDQAVAIVTSSRKASISYLQRRLKIGFNRAARLIDDLQKQKVIVTQSNGIREVLAPPPPESSNS